MCVDSLVAKIYQLHAMIFQTLITPTAQFVEGAIIFYQEEGRLLMGGPEFFGVVKWENQFSFQLAKGGTRIFLGSKRGNQTIGFSQIVARYRKAPSTNCTVSVYNYNTHDNNTHVWPSQHSCSVHSRTYAHSLGLYNAMDHT